MIIIIFWYVDVIVKVVEKLWYEMYKCSEKVTPLHFI